MGSCNGLKTFYPFPLNVYAKIMLTNWVHYTSRTPQEATTITSVRFFDHVIIVMSRDDLKILYLPFHETYGH